MQGESLESFLLSRLGNYGGTCDEDTSALCRLCARYCSEDLGCSFDIADAKKKILHMIKTCLPIDIESPDPYPTRICLNCNNYLELLFQFHNTAVQVQEIFKKKMSSSSSTSKNILGSRRKNKKKGDTSEESDLLEEIGSSAEINTIDLAEIADIPNKRSFAKRRAWSSEEKAIMMRHFSSYMNNGTLPSFHLCATVRQMNPILHSRSNSIMKAWVYNQQKRHRGRDKVFVDPNLTINEDCT